MLDCLKKWQFRGVFITSLVLTVYALTALFSNVNAGSTVVELDTDVTPLSGQSLVNSVLGGGLTATDITSKGTIYTFTHGIDIVGIDSGIILETSGRIPSTGQDSDLNNLMDYPYGGDTASLEFTIKATGSLLNFNYAFVSTEFDQDPRFNDIFGLFVSVNGGAYENIATIPLSTGAEVPVNINNLRSGIDHSNEVTRYSIVSNRQYSLFNSTPININNSIQPISNVFNAQKAVTPGDTVKIKFAIADVSDAQYDSYVLIEADSLSFEEQMARVNYARETIEKLYSGRTYVITTDDGTYTFKSSTNGEIPLAGADLSGQEYDFMGETITIVRKGIGNHPDSNPQTIVVAGRPEAPTDIAAPTGTPDDIYLDDIEITEDSIILEGSADQEYSLDLENWQSPDNTGHVTFSNLDPNTEYTVYTRYVATEDAPISNPTTGTSVTTRNMVRNLSYTITNYEGLYDGQPHSAFVSSSDGVEIRYSENLYGTYTGTAPTYTEPGNYTVYYYLSKDNYYPAYGALTIKIKDYDVINTTDEKTNYGSAKLLHSSAELKQMFDFTEEEKNKLADASTPAEIALTSTDATDTVDPEITEHFSAYLEENEYIGKIIDFRLYQKLLGEPEALSELVNPVQVSFNIPASLILSDEETAVRSYRILRLHDGETEEIDTMIDTDKVLTFAMNKFSYYAITYSDIAYESPLTELSEDSDYLIPNTAGTLTPNTGEMEKTLELSKSCAITTIVVSIFSVLFMIFTFSRLNGIRTRAKNLQNHFQNTN